MIMLDDAIYVAPFPKKNTYTGNNTIKDATKVKNDENVRQNLLGKEMFRTAKKIKQACAEKRTILTF